jgi:hypothetical protein
MTSQSQPKVPYVWLSHCKTEKDKEEVAGLLLNNNRHNKLFLSILSDLYEEIEKKGDKEEDYKEAGILALMAFRNGQMAMLKRIAALYNFTTKEGN